MKKNINFQRNTRFFLNLSEIITAIVIISICIACQRIPDEPTRIIKKTGISQGICVLLEDTKCELAIKLAQESEFLIYVQLINSEDIEVSRQAVEAAGFYGSRIFIEKGNPTRIHLADNLADVIIATNTETPVTESEVLRVLRPQGKAFLGKKELTKPFPEGIDDWSHPYHGPDNNPQSNDQIARAPYLTQFLAEPYYAPLPQVAVSAGGRIFQATGHLAFHEREEALLNSLVAYNGYNGTMLWKRKLTPGVMIHRNTMIATPEILYVGDDKSCKLINTSTGKLIDEIIPPIDIAGGTFWKWMAMENGILYALIGEQEQRDPVLKQKREAHGWPWYPLSKGFNQPDNPWGYGQNLLAINPKTKKIIWNHKETEDIDSRALGMKNGRIYIYRHNTFLACLDTKKGEEIWRKTPENDPELFNAIGEDMDRQDWRTNWRTTVYLKCSDEALYFAGPTIGKLLAVSAKDGSFLWEDPYNNYQLVLREDGLYGFSGQIDNAVSKKFDPLTGEVLAELDTRRRACTRPNGSVDAIFFRAGGGSHRLDLASQTIQCISPMRPTCFDGVTISNGLLYWWPSVCDCQATLYGITCLGPAGDFDFTQKATKEERLEQYGINNIVKLEETSADWPTFRANNTCDVTTEAIIPEKITPLWWFAPEKRFTPTAPITVGGILFFSGSDGIVRALETSTGKILWKAYTGGPVIFPPTYWEGRLLVGSGDGWVYAFEAMTGRLLWKFNAAPENRKIPVYGSLMSTWPVAGGVIVQDGVAYCAAGIVNYDGTYVYALDAANGNIIWQNNTSGHLDPDSRTGISVQGHMLISDDKLYLASGSSVSPAIFDLKNGQCLNDPEPLKSGNSYSFRGQELYKIGDEILPGGMPLYGDPDYPVYDYSVVLKSLYTSADDNDIFLINNQKIICFNKIPKKITNTLVYEMMQDLYSWGYKGVKFNNFGNPLWEYDCGEAVAIARGKNAIVYTSVPSKNYNINLVAALDIKNGKMLWSIPLISTPLPWGLIVDSEGRIIVATKDGQITCYGQIQK